MHYLFFVYDKDDDYITMIIGAIDWSQPIFGQHIRPNFQ